ncbi:MAG: hypothetical protein FJX57_04210, partial [Alphaproteobacteria bacterium]|nr:hypothetical protein [Alphaproteobacteria bacterium]
MTPNNEHEFPLSPLQQLLLLDARTGSGGGIDSLAFTLRGEIAEDVLEASWTRVTARHAAMRSAFSWHGLPQAMQFVARDARPRVVRADLSGADRAAQQDRIEARLREFSAAGWPLTEAPQIRLFVFRLAADELRIVVPYRPCMFDGWSVALIMREFFAGLDATANPDSTPAPPFERYIEWLRTQDVAGCEAFWRDALGSLSAPTALRMTTAGEDRRAGSSRETVRRPSSAQVDAIRSLSRTLRITPYGVLQAAWAALLGAYGGGDDIVFGTAVSGRPADLDDVELIAGVFFNNLPVRVTLSRHGTVAAHAKALQDFMRRANQNSHVSPVRIRELCGMPTTLPLYQSIVLFHNFPLKGTIWEKDRAFTIEDFEKPIETAFPLTLVCVPDLGFELRVIAPADVADEGLASRYLRDLLSLIDAWASNPDIATKDLVAVVGAPDVPLFAPTAAARRTLPRRAGFEAPATPVEREIASVF